MIIWTIGHSNRPYSEFLALLKSADIQTVVDCRSYPRSRFPHFTGFRLEKSLQADGIEYEWRGDNLGGRGENFDEAQTLDELKARADLGERIALMCSEGKVKDCHRGSILTPELESRGVQVEHILYESVQKSLL